jgi:hypothetical protein
MHISLTVELPYPIFSVRYFVPYSQFKEPIPRKYCGIVVLCQIQYLDTHKIFILNDIQENIPCMCMECQNTEESRFRIGQT